MIELYEVNPDEHWKRDRLLFDALTPEILQKKYSFTKKEMDSGLNGEIIRGKYIMEFSPKFLDSLKIDLLIKECDFFNEYEIANILGLPRDTVKDYKKRAVSKLKNNGKLRELLREALERNREVEITQTIRIG
jgi:hypothetical protein